MIWDDHELANGWGSHKLDRGSKLRNAHFTAIREVYRDFQHAHNPSTFGSGDLFYAFRYGNVGFLVLDLRGHRDIGRKRNPLMGAHQWKKIRTWLGHQAPQLGALFVVSSVPPIHVAPALARVGGLFKSDLRDQWTHPSNQPELRRLVRLLFDIAAAQDIPVIILGGDVHVGTVACVRSNRSEHQSRPLIYQFTSSPISNRPVEGKFGKLIEQIVAAPVEVEPGIGGRVLHFFNERNFGVVDMNFNVATDRYGVVLNLYREGVSRPFRFPLPA
jgi:alkaline phosphatase D